jgi:thiol-disulfide isomerase/thioredoxin
MLFNFLLNFMPMRNTFITLAAALCSFIAQSQPIPKWKITDVENCLADKKADVLVINFWATFCKPCVAEIPSFIKITDAYKPKNVKLLLVSLDLPSFYPAKISAFAASHGFNTDIVWLQETNADYFCPRVDKSWSGSIPATLIVNTKTGYRKFFEEEIDAASFEKELKLAIAGGQH